MISNINPLVIWIYLIYITLRIASIPFLIGYAVYKLINLIKKRRKHDCSCKLVAVPERMDPAKARGAYDATRIEAWNECISKILGGSNE